MATTSLPGPAGTADAGYRHARYADAFAEFGTPVFLPQCGGWVLRRRVPGSDRDDATSCYPIFACEKWDALQTDVLALSGDLVSLTIVTDPFATVGLEVLRRCFDSVIAFKEHFVVDLKQRASQPVSRHHSRYAARALRALDIELCQRPLEFLDEWVRLYELLVQKHRLHGMRAFSRQSFARQLTVPGVVMFRASREGVTVGLHIWYAQGDVGYAHVGATSDEGRALMASYGLYAAAIEWFTPRAQWLSLGGAAGTTERSDDDGLAFFKRGWSTGSRPVYVCGRILDAASYAHLAGKRHGSGAYFPEVQTRRVRLSQPIICYGPLRSRNDVSRRALLVLGMHRSGTSALSGVLQRLGVSMPRTLLPADDDNPGGYGESGPLTAFHDRLLDAVGSRWDAWVRLGPEWVHSPNAMPFVAECRSLLTQEFGDAPLFVVKDPRLCRLLPFWVRVLEAESITPAAIIPIRSPFEVARSLEARNRLPREQSLLMWLRHVLDAEVETRNTVRSFVAYRDLLKDWKAVTNRMSMELHVTWPSDARTAETEVADFLRPDLCHHFVEVESDGVPFPLSEWLARTYDALEVLVRSENGTARAYETLDEVKYEFDRAASLFGPIIETGRSRVADLEGEQNALRQHVSAIETERENLSQRVSQLESERDALERRASNLEARGSLLEQQVSNLTQHVSNLTQHASNLEQQVSNLEQRNAVVARELAGATHHVEALLHSASWRITSPLRAVARIFLGRPKVL